MGLLDDAIREHLELKRAHGASDEEIVRAEQEALAPARRDPSAEAAAASPAANPPEELADAPPPVEEEPVADAPAPPVDEPVHAGEYAAEPAPADLDEPLPGDSIADEETRIREVVPIEDELIEDESELPAAGDGPVEAPEPGTPKPHGDPTFDEEFDPDEAPVDEQLSPEDDRYRARTSILDEPLDDSEPPPPAQPPADAEEQDVLEETPDFLQETPEHDKLWFEQKPPRDFDFD